MVSKEKKHYREACKECKDNVQQMFTVDEKYVPPPVAVPHPAMSVNTTIRYSFDMAQQVRDFSAITLYCTYLLQVHYLSNPLKPGQKNLHLTPCKCTIFGVSCEGLPRRVMLFYNSVKHL